MTNKRVVAALESIATELKELNNSARRAQELNSLILTNNEAHLKLNRESTNLSMALTLTELLNKLGNVGLDFLVAVQNGELEKARDIQLSKVATNTPKKRGRKPKAATAEIKSEPKKRGRKPKNMVQ